MADINWLGIVQTLCAGWAGWELAGANGAVLALIVCSQLATISWRLTPR